MIRRLFRIGLMLGVLSTVAYTLTRLTASRRFMATEPAPTPVEPWVDPEGGVCPVTHPVKAKLTSRIFHLPGMLHYERLHPDRCYATAALAEADGLRAAKR